MQIYSYHFKICFHIQSFFILLLTLYETIETDQLLLLFYQDPANSLASRHSHEHTFLLVDQSQQFSPRYPQSSPQHVPSDIQQFPHGFCRNHREDFGKILGLFQLIRSNSKIEDIVMQIQKNSMLYVLIQFYVPMKTYFSFHLTTTFSTVYFCFI